MPVKGSGLATKKNSQGAHGQVFHAAPVQQFQSRLDNGFLGKGRRSSKIFKKKQKSLDLLTMFAYIV
jgi:hypothetical protein